ncbi:MAG TPA: hypothetical protein PK040_01635 [Anaerolineaceae bacterium]|nr:hypothetical protein [Anaerolineaceae bacterium]
MPALDEIRDNYNKKLDNVLELKQHEHAADLKRLHNSLATLPGFSTREDAAKSLLTKTDRTPGLTPPPLPLNNALFNITDSSPLKDLDEVFLQVFNIQSYFPAARLRYQTVYCETLQEFFTPFLNKLDYSRQAREAALDQLVKEAEENATRGGTYGVNLPGQACYLNGWLFCKQAGINPQDYRSHPEVLRAVLSTVVHEKLGHGFLSVYSEMGKLKSALNLDLVQIASAFPSLSRDDATSRIKFKQYELLFNASCLLEEGWATWIQNYFEQNILQNSTAHEYSVRELIGAVENIPCQSADQEQYVTAMLQSLAVLLSDEMVNSELLHNAVLFTELVDQQLEDYFSQTLGQPLKYVLGSLILHNCAENLGQECVPYAALIAANVTFNPDKVGVADLAVLLGEDPRFRPNTRLAAISKLRLNEKNNVKELAERVASELSLSVPAELKK